MSEKNASKFVINDSDRGGDRKRRGPQHAWLRPDRAPAASSRSRKEGLRRWVKLTVQPILFLASGVILIVGLGAAQKLGWISAGGGGGVSHASAGEENVRYICPMMCTPPQTAPGRCPVCAMELVPAASGGGDTDSGSIQIDPAARRVANIRTVAVKAAPLTCTIRAIGELSYDEGTLKTIAAYVDGRLERLYADYTGVVVKRGDHLALLYSPELYSAQVELLEARTSLRQGQSSTLPRVVDSRRRLYGSARKKATELGMTEEQVQQLEQSGKANSRLYLCAPISGTVIEKCSEEGQYVNEGQAIYRLADLSTVWLMLELFPDDAATIRYGQRVTADVQSLPGREFSGRVAFIDPTVNPATRTVGVRVVIPNPDGLLRVGDYAKATINAPAGRGDSDQRLYDPELVNKWIGPRHPHVIESSPGTCRVCGVDLVPASRFGFTDKPAARREALVVPRNAVLMAGGNSVVYVESEPGRFEVRRVVLGPSSGDTIVILNGVKEGDQVATSGNFLIDSQMQLAGKPSLIDPTKAGPALDGARSAEVVAALAQLSEEDRVLAESQRICPVTRFPLGSMGVPPKVDVNGRPIFICCEGCRESLLAEPQRYLSKLAGEATPETASSDIPPMEVPAVDVPSMDLPSMELPRMTEPDTPSLTAPQTNSDPAPAITAALAKLSSADRVLAQRQAICPVTGMPLGSMGAPIKVDVNGRPVFICCEGCRESLLAEPVKYLAKLGKEVAR